jgi:hypothetical protein
MTKTLIQIQDEAVESILPLRTYSDKGSAARVCGRLARSVRPIRKSFEAQLTALGFSSSQIYQAWRDVCDVVILKDNALE